jgi:hypothetical protein
MLVLAQRTQASPATNFRGVRSRGDQRYNDLPLVERPRDFSRPSRAGPHAPLVLPGITPLLQLVVHALRQQCPILPGVRNEDARRLLSVHAVTARTPRVGLRLAKGRAFSLRGGPLQRSTLVAAQEPASMRNSNMMIFISAANALRG